MNTKKHVLKVLFSVQVAMSGFAYGAEVNWYAQGVKAEISGNSELAIENYKKSESEGVVDAAFAIGRIYKELGADKLSYDWFKKSALSGDKFSQYELGLIHLHGNSAQEIDEKQAIKWLSDASAKGVGEASLQLFYTTKDSNWLIIAAEQGVAEAAFKLSQAYKEGHYGLDTDDYKSKFWFSVYKESNEEGESL